ncbi:MAG: T9SS type A sorting domain-containing protein [Saprospiraceae bacterium]|nr:T9SS type A sorting domain-containing protein [Saprospiraceae bacterium]
MKLENLFSLALLWAFAAAVQAQCSFNPTISAPDSVLCPGQTVTFTTQEYDSYQWYRREYLDTVAVPIAGATGQTLEVNETYIVSYVWVEATEGGCTEASPEVLVDGHVFLLPFVVQTGDFTIDPQTGSIKICEGDTMFLDFSYGTNVTWFNNGEPIPGATSPLFAVTESGSYTAQGAPGICPDFILGLGVELDVVVVNCATSVQPEPVLAQYDVYPNPTSGLLTVEKKTGPALERLELFNANGQLVKPISIAPSDAQQVSLEGLPNGVYYLRMQSAGVVTMAKVVKS